MAKKKILLLSDDLRMSSGVGTMSKEFVLGTLHHFDWVQMGGAIKHPDIMETIEKELEIIAEYDDKLSILNKYFTINGGSKGVING